MVPRGLGLHVRDASPGPAGSASPSPPTTPHSACREREALEARLREQLEAAQAAGAAADRDARALREQKYGLDARVSELSHRLGAAEGSNRCGGTGHSTGRLHACRLCMAQGVAVAELRA